MRVAAVILAAGASRRLGQAKQLVPWEGEPLLRRTARLAWEAGCRPVRVVLGANAEICREAIQGLDMEVILNPGWREGMGSSIRAGIAGLDPEVDALLLLVCDQPALDGAVLARILAAHHSAPERVVASHYSGIRGIPALFPRRCLAELGALGGDRGARDLLREGGAVGIPFPGGELDLDTPGDLARALPGGDPDSPDPAAPPSASTAGDLLPGEGYPSPARASRELHTDAAFPRTEAGS